MSSPIYGHEQNPNYQNNGGELWISLGSSGRTHENRDSEEVRQLTSGGPPQERLAEATNFKRATIGG